MSAHEATQTFDAGRYARLLAEVLPAIIETEEENARLGAEIERLMIKDEEGGLSAEEHKLLDLLTLLVERFEEELYALNLSTPQSRLRHLMEARGLKQTDLEPALGSKGVVSEIVNGKRLIGPKVARVLGEYFGVDYTLFL
jgi:HTH-type transcriptional regulator/antitoxin HigA